MKASVRQKACLVSRIAKQTLEMMDVGPIEMKGGATVYPNGRSSAGGSVSVAGNRVASGRVVRTEDGRIQIIR